MKVEVRPLDIPRWHDKKGIESFKRPIKLRALVGSDLRYATGLTEDEEKEYGAKLNQNLSPFYDDKTPHPFWDSNLGVIELQNNTMFFDTEKPLDYVKLKVMKASKYIANSMKEYEEGFYPEASHVIYDEREEVEAVASKVQLRNTVREKVLKLSPTSQLEIILIVGGKSLKGQSQDYTIVALEKLIESKPEQILRFLDMDKERRTIHALVKECLQKSILVNKNHKIFYMDIPLGVDEYDAIDYLSNPENQDLKIRLMQAIN